VFWVFKPLEVDLVLGLELVELLVLQLCGELSKLDKEGVFYKIIFEEIED
jgi:two-component sensor histidine kinase